MTTEIIAIVGGNVDDKTGDIFLGLKGRSEKPYAVQLNRGIVDTLVSTLLGLMEASREKHGNPEEFQPINLSGVQQYRDPDGFSHLQLILENRLRIPLLFDQKSMAGLQTALEELSKSGTIRPAPLSH